MAVNDKYRYLDELEKSQNEDERGQGGRSEWHAPQTAGQRIKMENEMLKKEERKRQRRKQVLLSWLIIVVAVAAVAAVVVLVLARKGGSGSGGSGGAAAVVTPEASSQTGSIIDEGVSSGGSMDSTADSDNGVLLAWDYYSEGTAPEGDIVEVSQQIYSYDDMREDLYFLQQRYPEQMHVYKLGTTADDRDIIDVVIGSDAARNEVIIQYSMHAREYINTPLAMRQIETLMKGWNSESYEGQLYSALFANVKFHILPMANPDGVTISQYGFEGIRNEELRANLNSIWQYDIAQNGASADYASYYTRWKANARGVDLNRNFNQNWETTGGTPSNSSGGYRGDSANSELETQAIIRLQESINCVGEIAYHSQGQVVYWDYGTSGDLYTKDDALATRVCDLTGYVKTSTIASEQNSSGCSDYFILVVGVPAITIETGLTTCPVPYEQWPTVWEQNKDVLPALAELFAGF